jgi:16S rRNA (guanine966-N2)-methyltransferase
MRIIAGSAGGLPLKAPPDGLRPTMDRVRAAIFSSLGDLVPDAKILDLFAGSGAMGIEALSRGADAAVFVDSNERCTRCIRENLRSTRLEGGVQTLDAYRFIDLYAEPSSFDLIFADPPYHKRDTDTDHAAALVRLEKLAAALRPSGLLVLEKNARDPLPQDSVFDLVKSRRYGGSEILYLAPR